MVVETLWPDTAPWWLSLFIWMALFWQYILFAFIPAFYVAVTKLFGFPLLQRWSNEVVVMLYPSKVKFGKITQQFEPYFGHKKGVYWMADPLQPTEFQTMPQKYVTKMNALKEKYDELAHKEPKAEKDAKEMEKILKQQSKIQKKTLTVNPVNQIHIFTHAVNQPIYNMERRETKVDEILNNAAKPKKIAKHGIWLMQNPKMHFHRHFQLIVDPSHTKYMIIPVKEKQQFGIGFWHSLGVVVQKEVESEKEIEIEGSSGGGKQIIQTVITTSIVLQQMKEVQDFQNFSASRAYMLLQRRARIEANFMPWIKGELPPMFWIVIMGAVAIVAVIFYFLHGSSPPTTGPPPPPGRIL